MRVSPRESDPTLLKNFFKEAGVPIAGQTPLFHGRVWVWVWVPVWVGVAVLDAGAYGSKDVCWWLGGWMWVYCCLCFSA